MNSENLNRVADAIEKHEIASLGYNQKAWLETQLEDLSGHNCGTTACVAGWTIAVMLGRIPTDKEAMSTEKAKRFLGLSEYEANALFRAWPATWIGFQKNDLAPPQAMDAVRTLRYAAKHHRIDWGRARLEAESA